MSPFSGLFLLVLVVVAFALIVSASIPPSRPASPSTLRGVNSRQWREVVRFLARPPSRR